MGLGAAGTKRLVLSVGLVLAGVATVIRAKGISISNLKLRDAVLETSEAGLHFPVATPAGFLLNGFFITQAA